MLNTFGSEYTLCWLFNFWKVGDTLRNTTFFPDSVLGKFSNIIKLGPCDTLAEINVILVLVQFIDAALK